MTEEAASRPAADGWRPAAEADEHPLSRLDGVEVGQGVHLAVEVGPRSAYGATYFRAFLESDDLGRTLDPILLGLHSAGAYAGHNWVEVVDYRGRVAMAAGEVEVPEGIDLQVVQALAALVPPGGHLMMEYESEYRRHTARALAQGVPPAATPLGAMMFSSGCGVAFTDWYIAEGGREGPRKLQGFRAADSVHGTRRAREMVESLEAFMDASAELDWDLQVKCRPLAEAAITVLRAHLGLGPREFGTMPSDLP